MPSSESYRVRGHAFQRPSFLAILLFRELRLANAMQATARPLDSPFPDSGMTNLHNTCPGLPRSGLALPGNGRAAAIGAAPGRLFHSASLELERHLFGGAPGLFALGACGLLRGEGGRLGLQ